MKILFVWPKAFELLQTIPLAFAQLVAGIDLSRHDVRLLDCNLDDIPADSARFHDEVASYEPDVVGFSCWAFGAEEVATGARSARRASPGSTIVVGGVHVSIYPEFFRLVSEIDFIFRGEAERAFPLFLDELDEGTQRWDMVPGLGWRNSDGGTVMNPTEVIDCLDELPPPNYAFVNLPRYHAAGYNFMNQSKRNVALFATRGCPFSCEYCCTPIHPGKRYRRYSIAYLTDLIESLYQEFNVDYVTFMDDNLTENLEWAKNLCRALADLDLPITYCIGRGVRMDRTDPELFGLMKSAGFDSVTLAIESGSDQILGQMRKQMTTAPVIEKARQVKDAGLLLYAFVMYGYPDETEEEVLRTLELLRACRPDYFLLFRFNPIPGTPVYNRLVERGEIPEIGSDSIPYNFCRGSSTYTPPSLADFDFRGTLIREYLRMFVRRPGTLRTFLRRNGFRSVLGVLGGKITKT